MLLYSVYVIKTIYHNVWAIKHFKQQLKCMKLLIQNRINNYYYICSY